MSAVEPLPLEAIEDPELRALFAESRHLGAPDALFAGILARAPAQGKPLLRALIMSHRDGNVDHKLKEVIRVLLARFARDPYFAALRSRQALEAGLTEEKIAAGSSGNYEGSPLFTEAEKSALRYADWMYVDASKVDAAFYDELKQHYSEAQIMELGSFIALHYGMQMFMRSMQAVMPRAR
jgi:alkylhydroperoxidase family enzyme